MIRKSSLLVLSRGSDFLFYRGAPVLCLLFLSLFLTETNVHAQWEERTEEIRTLVNQGDYSQAKERGREWIRGMEETRVSVWSPFLRAYRETGEYGKALNQIESFHENRDVPSPFLLAEKGRLLHRTGQYQAGLESVNRALESRSDLLNGRWIRIRLAYTTGRHGQMATDFEFLRNFVDRNRSRLNLPYQYISLARGLWKEAVREGSEQLVRLVAEDLLPEAMDRFENHTALRAFWGWCFTEKESNQDAVKTFKEVLAVHSGHPSARAGMAELATRGEGIEQPRLLGGGNPVEDHLEEALSTNPAHGKSLTLRGRQNLIDGDLEAARKTGERMFQTNDRDLRGLTIKAGYHYFRSETTRYEEIRQKVFEMNPHYGDLDAVLGHILTQRMRFSTAQEFFNRAMERDPKLRKAQRERGINLLRLGKEEEGQKVLEEYFDSNPFDVHAYNKLLLMDRLEEEFASFTTDAYTVRINKSEADFARPYVMNLLEEGRRKMSERYQFDPEKPVLVELFHNHRDFSVRTAGIQGLGALGASFGKTFFALSPRARDQMGAYNWGSTVWHELAHVYHIQKADFRMPRWFTEGLATYEESLARDSWKRHLDQKIYNAWKTDQLPSLEQLERGQGGQLGMYLYGSLIMDHLHEAYGFEAINHILDGYADGRSTAELTEKHLDRTLGELDKDMENYLQSYYRDVRLRTPLTRSDLSTFQENVRSEENRTGGRAGMARFFLQQGEMQKAEEYARDVLQTKENHATANMVMGEIHRQNRSWAPAREYLQKAVEQGRNDFQTLFSTAKVMEEEDQVEEAISYYEKAREAFPRYVEGEDNPYLRLFDLYRETNQPRKAVNRLEAFTRIDHLNFDAHLQMAEIYHGIEAWGKLRDLLSDLVYINYRNLKLHYMLARACREEEDFSTAHREYRVLVHLLEQDASRSERDTDALKSDYLLEAARMSKRLGNLERSRSEAERAMELSEGNQQEAGTFLEDLDGDKSGK